MDSKSNLDKDVPQSRKENHSNRKQHVCHHIRDFRNNLYSRSFCFIFFAARIWRGCLWLCPPHLWPTPARGQLPHKFLNDSYFHGLSPRLRHAALRKMKSTAVHFSIILCHPILPGIRKHALIISLVFDFPLSSSTTLNEERQIKN